MKGRTYVLDDYAERTDTYGKIVQSLLEGIQKIEGKKCRQKVESAGLSQLHKYFPVEKVLLLENHLLHRMRNDLYYWTFRVGREDLGLEHTFFVDHLIMIRIHYPFLVARQAKTVLRPPYPAAEKLKLILAACKNFRLFFNLFDRVKRNKLARWQSSYDPEGYHRQLPTPARSHGPHIDTWYGHSYSGVNLWWSIDGVNEDNTVILYPDLFGQSVAYDPTSMYVKSGVPLTKPHKMVLEPGQLLVFNPEILHSTQVNISDSTRIAIGTRLNPNEPRFNKEAPFNFEHWHSSDDLARRRFSSIRLFPAKEYSGDPPVVEKSATRTEMTVRMSCSEKLINNEPVAVCRSTDLHLGQKIAIDFKNAKVLLYRGGGMLRALSRICPHLGIDLADGYHDDKQVFCPGHGIAYSFEDGSSRCEAFALHRYEVFERDGIIYLRLGEKVKARESAVSNQ
jgi:nitrite reductase/ring-hydroxylating ferredoxin subunit